MKESFLTRNALGDFTTGAAFHKLYIITMVYRHEIPFWLYSRLRAPETPPAMPTSMIQGCDSPHGWQRPVKLSGSKPHETIQGEFQSTTCVPIRTGSN